MSFKRALGKLDEHVARLQSKLAQEPRLATALVALFVSLSVVLGVAIRAAPYALNKFEFFEFDSYIEYWQAMYVYEKGPLAWYSLTRENPDTHIFWYPWGRDFIYTSYPLLPIWTALTYQVARVFGLGLHEWAALQPLIFASVAIVLAYFAAREVAGSRLAGVLASLLTAVLPAAIERTVIGFVEKEGVAAVFIYLFVCFYAKMLKSLDKPSWKTRTYLVLGSLSLALVGWLWGGYVFILGTVVAFLVLAPLLVRRYLTKSFLVHNAAFVILAMLFVLPSPANARTLGLYPLTIKGLGAPLLAALTLPLLYYYLAVDHRRVGLRKPLLTQARYFLLLVAGGVAAAVLSTYGYLPIGGRLAWALGLRFIQAPPLVQSIAEHQSPLSTPGTTLAMLHAWGVPLNYMYLMVASPLVLGVLGLIYLFYKGTPEKVYVALAFLLAFYSYLNAAYMIATAAYFGVLVAGAFLARLFDYAFPLAVQVQKKRVKAAPAKASYVRARAGASTRLVALALVLAALAATALTAQAEYVANSNKVYMFGAGLTDIGYSTESWYKTVEELRRLPEGSLVIAWWDYGYGISVVGGKASVADGSTINGTQIGIIGLIMSSLTTGEAAKLVKLFDAKPNSTYIMVIDALLVLEEENKTAMWPVLAGGAIPGLVDIPKSIWMIRIGNYTVNELRASGINVSYVDTRAFMYLYSFGDAVVISPPFNEPEKIPLLYRLVVDAALYWAEQRGKQGEFCWYNGTAGIADPRIAGHVSEHLGLAISTEIQPTGYSCTSTRPLANDTYLKPYAVVVEPFKNPRTGEPLKVTFAGREGELYSLILLYRFERLPEN